LIEAEQAAEAAERRQRQDIADVGPPIDSGITPTNWHFWHLYDFVLCPAKGVSPPAPKQPAASANHAQ